jgi:hypothetical protein
MPRRDWRASRVVRWTRNQLLRCAHALDENAGAMSEAEYAASCAQKTAEWPARHALNWRYAEAMEWLETNVTSLDHWQRFVEHVEAIMRVFRDEARDREPARRTHHRQPFVP